ncbi:MAG: hypothetical protein ACTSRI_15120 [Promethearchaeota archaeon]
MKNFCYFALIIGFLIFYQQEPVLTLVIVAISAGSYFFFKRKKKSSKGASSGLFFSGKNQSSVNKFKDLLVLMVLQEFFKDDPIEERPNKNQDKKEEEIDKIKNEVLDLLEEY